MRVLVTGGAGFVGSHLVESLLARGDEVAVLDSFHPFYPRATKERHLAGARRTKGFLGVFEVDVRDAERVRSAFRELRPQRVVHLAARAGVRPSLEVPTEYVDANVTGTQVMLSASVEAGVEAFVFASSSTVYGERPREPFHEELAADRPISPYGASKRAGELLCHAATHQSGMPTVCLRLFTVYGPRQRPDLAISAFAHRALAGKPIEIFGDGSVERDFTYVSDTVDGFVRALDRAEGHRVYNLARGKPVGLLDTIDALERALGRPIEKRFGPPAPGDLPRTWASIERARAELGYAPSVELEEGLARYVRWLREEETACAPA